MLDVLLTVPHGAPGNDRGAPAVAHALHERLDTRGLKVRTLISKTCRYKAFDMNRGEARGSHFRSEVRKAIELDRPEIHIDVHSFPDQIPRFGHQDIVLLHGFEHPDSDKPLQDLAALRTYAKLLCVPGVAACVQPSEYPNDLCQDVILTAGQARDRCILAEHFDEGDPEVYAAAHVQAITQVLTGTTEKYDGRAGPRYPALKKGKVKLTDEERALVMQRKAVWHHGPKGQATPAVWKSVVNGKTWYVTNTHRAMNVTSTLKGCIKQYHDFIKGTAESVEGAPAKSTVTLLA